MRSTCMRRHRIAEERFPERYHQEEVSSCSRSRQVVMRDVHEEATVGAQPKRKEECAMCVPVSSEQRHIIRFRPVLALVRANILSEIYLLFSSKRKREEERIHTTCVRHPFTKNSGQEAREEVQKCCRGGPKKTDVITVICIRTFVLSRGGYREGQRTLLQ